MATPEEQDFFVDVEEIELLLRQAANIIQQTRSLFSPTLLRNSTQPVASGQTDVLSPSAETLSEGSIPNRDFDPLDNGHDVVDLLIDTPNYSNTASSGINVPTRFAANANMLPIKSEQAENIIERSSYLFSPGSVASGETDLLSSSAETLLERPIPTRNSGCLDNAQSANDIFDLLINTPYSINTTVSSGINATNRSPAHILPINPAEAENILEWSRSFLFSSAENLSERPIPTTDFGSNNAQSKNDIVDPLIDSINTTVSSGINVPIGSVHNANTLPIKPEQAENLERTRSQFSSTLLQDSTQIRSIVSGQTGFLPLSPKTLSERPIAARDFGPLDKAQSTNDIADFFINTPNSLNSTVSSGINVPISSAHNANTLPIQPEHDDDVVFVSASAIPIINLRTPRDLLSTSAESSCEPSISIRDVGRLDNAQGTNDIVDLSIDIDNSSNTILNRSAAHANTLPVAPDQDDDVVFIGESVIPVIDLCAPRTINRARRRNRYQNMLVDDNVILIDDLAPSPEKKPKISDTTAPFPPNSKTNEPTEVKPTNIENKPLLICSVCMDSAINNKPISTICGHIFCLECISTSIHFDKKCPLCKRTLNKNSYHRVYI